jgi:hypothetical protein
MTYQICILDTENVYKVLYSTTDGNGALDFYNARVAENFSTMYSLTNNTFNLVIPCFVFATGDMTTTQLNNLRAMCPTAVEFDMCVCF